MLSPFFALTNFLAVLAAAVAYFLLGALWYSALFWDIRTKALEAQGVILKEPSKREAAQKLLLTFLAGLVASFGMAYLIYWTGSHRFTSGLALGLAVGLCFGATGIGVSYLRESRPLKLIIIDSGYQVVGITMIGIVLSVWK
ncbi:MAG: DUF1761 domain-containing protein [Bacteroidota bacterium]